MPRIAFTNVSIASQFGAYRYTGDDGWPAALVVDEVYVECADGRSFVFPNVRHVRDEDGTFPRRLYDPLVAVERIRAAGTIDPELWVEVEPYPGLEAVFADEAYREAGERFAYTGSHFG